MEKLTDYIISRLTKLEEENEVLREGLYLVKKERAELYDLLTSLHPTLNKSNDGTREYITFESQWTGEPLFDILKDMFCQKEVR